MTKALRQAFSATCLLAASQLGCGSDDRIVEKFPFDTTIVLSSACEGSVMVRLNIGFPSGAEPNFPDTFATVLTTDGVFAVRLVGRAEVYGDEDLSEAVSANLRAEVCSIGPDSFLVCLHTSAESCRGGIWKATQSESEPTIEMRLFLYDSTGLHMPEGCQGEMYPTFCTE